MEKWENWCRLCTKPNTTINIFSTLDSMLDLSFIIKKYFNIEITPSDGKPSTICERCFNFLTNINKFYDNCIKSELLYSEIVSNDEYKSYSYDNLIILKNKFQLANYEPDHSLNPGDLYLPTFKIDQFTDTNDLNGEFVIKEELAESFVSALHENDISLSNDELKPEIKNEIDTIDRDYDCNVSDENYDEEFEMKSNKVRKQNHDRNTQDSLDDSKDKEKKTRIRKPRGEKLWKCDECDKIFTKRPSYRNHMISKHSDAKLFCSQCPKFFTSKNSLRIHEKIHLPDDLKPHYVCNICQKQFSKSANLNQHIKAIHYNQRLFVCDECGKDFKTKATLQRHQLSHTDERPFQCPDCPKRFKSLEFLNLHSDHHSDTKYPCNLCSAVFNVKKSLRIHMIVHTDEKKYKCKLCGNEYKRSKALKYHMKSHSGYRHPCPYCEKTFADTSNCRNHQKSVHPFEWAAAKAEAPPPNQ